MKPFAAKAMRARSGITIVELLLAGAIFSIIAFGTLTGVIKLSGYVEQRAELMAADSFCWDLAWKLFNENYSVLAGYVTDLGRGEVREVRGEVWPASRRGVDSEYGFLPQLQVPGHPPVCYITMSNTYDTAGNPDGVAVAVNLEWGPEDYRRYLVPRPETTDSDIVFNHPIEFFRSGMPRTEEE